MTYTLHPEAVTEQFGARQRPNDPVVGKTYPAVGVALILVADVAAFWLLRIIF